MDQQQHHVILAKSHSGNGSHRTLEELFRATLAQHPERPVVGELRGEESLDVIEGVLRNGDGMSNLVRFSTDDVIDHRTLVIFLEDTGELQSGPAQEGDC